MTVKIYTLHNHPKFIRWQKLLFQKFVTEEYEYYVVNTADSDSMKESIRQECESNDVSCIDLPFLNNQGTPSARNRIPLQWTWDNHIAKENSTCVIMDSDMFLLKPFNFSEYLGTYDIAGIIHKRAHIWYPWNGLSIFAGELPEKDTLNFREGKIESVRVDVSGHLHVYLQKHPEIKVKPIYDGGFICSKNENIHLLPEEIKDKYEDSFLSQIFEQAFFHLRAGSNWNNSDNYEKKITFMNDMVDIALSEGITFPSPNGYRFIDADDIRDLDAPVRWTEYTRYVDEEWTDAQKPSFSIKSILKKLIKK
ncbi:MAG: hypothetical protein LIO93_11065 [Bacteroidales bacterium]|nr:hypothetical protein [Bacteroidales bacterium]